MEVNLEHFNIYSISAESDLKKEPQSEQQES